MSKQIDSLEMSAPFLDHVRCAQGKTLTASDVKRLKKKLKASAEKHAGKPFVFDPNCPSLDLEARSAFNYVTYVSFD